MSDNFTNTGNPYYDSMRHKEAETTKILPQQTNEELNKRVIAGAALMSKEILESVKIYFNGLLGEMVTKGKNTATVDKAEIELHVKNIQDHLNQCY